ncbi:tyrosine-type recombinase/integrase [Flavobacterium sp. LB2P84]|uniref:tyrosine-type recombinase/integrase n=1 Tax=Flavobacterium yafengii TaxID=3041253 RepID=UPI0024A93A98|nr:site-specific integrase [Flavobacterium yafengii]MDI6032690.1 tyrosine-type recombinase/integrase [Flavobacterium yafengii]
MQNPEVHRASKIIFVDYKPAELKLNKEWIIVYYSKNPISNKLERIRLRVPTLDSKTDRLKLAKFTVVAINVKLAAGWSPFIEQAGTTYKTFQSAVDDFLSSIKKQVKDNVARPDTLRTYNSNLNLLQQYVKEKKLNIVFALELNKNFCVNYLDWIYIERESSPRTRNNHLGFLRLFSSFLIGRGVLNENPTLGIKNMKLLAKKRQVFPEKVKQTIYEELMTYNNGFHTVCMATYFCFIRNTELGKIKVWNFNFNENTIFINKEISKNKKDETITIPSQFLDVIKKHVGENPSDFYVFSSDQFKPGLKKMPVRKIGSAWEALRDKLKLESIYQFYGLKDTGITDLLNSGVPAIKVRDQARHYDIKITEMYAQRKDSFDSFIQNAAITFGNNKKAS